MSRAAVALVVVGACGRIDFGVVADGPLPDVLAPCAPTAPFGAPVLVAGLESTAADVTLRLQSDELNGVFWSLRTGDGELFAASRPDLASPFTATILSGISDPFALDVDPTVSPDGGFLVFGSSRSGGAGGFDFYESQRQSGAYMFSTRIVSLDTAANETQPNWSPAENALYFGSDRSGPSRLYRATRTGPAAYGPATEITELASSGDDFDPAPSADGLALYFHSTRPGGPGGGDIFVATRASLADPFGPATLVNVNSPAVDGSSFISPDQCRLYFTSDRTGTPKLYVASR